MDIDTLIKNLLTPCGRTTGHGESCVAGRECRTCLEKKLASEVITNQRQEIDKLQQNNVTRDS